MLQGPSVLQVRRLQCSSTLPGEGRRPNARPQQSPPTAQAWSLQSTRQRPLEPQHTPASARDARGLEPRRSSPGATRFHPYSRLASRIAHPIPGGGCGPEPPARRAAAGHRQLRRLHLAGDASWRRGGRSGSWQLRAKSYEFASSAPPVRGP